MCCSPCPLVHSVLWQTFRCMFPLPGSLIQDMETSSPWSQLCCPHPLCWQSLIETSLPSHLSDSNQMGPSPEPWSWYRNCACVTLNKRKSSRCKKRLFLFQFLPKLIIFVAVVLMILSHQSSVRVSTRWAKIIFCFVIYSFKRQLSDE